MNKKNCLCLCLAAFLAAGLPLTASNLLDFDTFNARLYGSAESLLTVTGDLNNLENCPASLADISVNELTTGFIRWADLMSILRAGYGRQLGAIGTIAASVLYAPLDPIPNYDAYGASLGTLKDADVLLTAAYARKFGENLRVGASLKYLSMKLSDSFSGSWMGISCSALAAIPVKSMKGRILTGAGIQNLNIVQAKVISVPSAYPVTFYAGGVYSLPLGDVFKLDAGLTFRYQTQQHFYLSVGAEGNYKDFLFARAGIYLIKRDFDSFAFGLGIRKDLLGMNVRFDYSISLLDFAPAHFLQVGIAFGGS
jgi:hypothetical protein